MAVAVLAGLTTLRHDRRLCESCVGALPLNPGQSAAYYHRRFMVAHLAARRSFMIVYILVLLASNCLLVSPGGQPRLAAQFLWVAIQASLVYVVLSHDTHRRLQPWCPSCRGGGDLESLLPDPAPTGTGST